MTEREREKIRHELRKVADEFLRALKEDVNSCVLLCDVEALEELVKAVKVLTGYRLVRTISEAGFRKELTELCDKVGRGKK